MTENIPTKNNNPGDLKDPSTGNFQQYSDPAQGKAALYNDLTAKMTGTSKTGIGPDSSLLDFSKVYAPKLDNNDPTQYAANLANKLKVSPDTKIGSLTGRIDDFADAVSSNEGYQKGYNPKPFSQPQGGSPFSVDITGNRDQTQQPESLASKAWGVAKGIGNFLFPAIGDVKDIVTGQNKKTPLQIAGDIGLTVAPFIPGLGEYAEGERAATIAKGALLGYGTGVSANLSEGKGIGESVAPNATNIISGLVGGSAPVALSKASGLIKNLSGIDPQVMTELEKYGAKADPKDVQLYDKYINATKAHATDLTSKSPLTMAADQLDKAAEIVSNKTDKAGALVGAVKEKVATTPLGNVNPVGDEFWKNVQDKYGLNIFTKPNGKVVLKEIPGTMIQTSSADASRIENMANQLNVLNNPKTTVKQATEVMQNLYNMVDYSKSDIYGKTNDPLEGLIKHTANNLNDVIRESSPDLAKANDSFSSLKDLQKEIKTMAGGNLNRGELMMRRIFSGDKSGDVVDFFNKLKSATGVDLTKQAVMAKHAITSIGGSADKTLLDKMISGAATNVPTTIPDIALSLGKAVAKKVSNPENVGRKIIQGSQPGFIQKYGQGIATGLAARGGKAINGLLK